MPTIALVIFAVAAVGGLILALRHFRNQPLPMPLALVHGAAGAAGLVLLALAVFGGTTAPDRLPLALGLLVAAALGGFVLFAFHLRAQRAPSPVVVIHALVAVAGVVVLALAIL